jgi:hypothetical protein
MERRTRIFFSKHTIAPGTDPAAVTSGSEVSFLVGRDTRTFREVAFAVALLPKGTITSMLEDRLPGGQTDRCMSGRSFAGCVKKSAGQGCADIDREWGA